VRALVLSCPVGESHSAMARTLARQLDDRPEVTGTRVLDDFRVLGPRLGDRLERGFRRHLGQARRSYEVAYWSFTRLAPVRGLGEHALSRLGADALQATVRREMPDVVVSTYPVLDAVLARLRGARRLGCPAAAVVGPLGGLDFWVQRDLDLHLLNYPEALGEVERRAGPGSAVAVRPLVRAEFTTPPTREQARATLGVDPEQRLLVVSGGGWGAGDLTGAIGACLTVAGAQVLVVTGRNESARESLDRRFGDESRVTVLGFTDQMPVLLSAADALVTATAGLSCVEARMCGCPMVCYGFAVGHVRDNTRALAAHGLAATATTPDRLAHELRATLAATRITPPLPDGLPTAAEVIVRLASRGPAG
jgi:processive 1,2-diacylglycerol beta-glucosyltransferase